MLEHFLGWPSPPPLKLPLRVWGSSSAVFCTADGRKSLYFTIGRPFSLKIPPLYGDIDPICTLFPGPIQVHIQTVCRSVQRFFSGLLIVTDHRPTDRQTSLLVCNNRTHLHSALPSNRPNSCCCRATSPPASQHRQVKH